MASKAAASKAKMNTKEESISQEKFFNYITIISKAIQVIETEYSGTKYNGLIYTIQKNVRANISEEGDFLKVFIDDKKVNISPIQETKGGAPSSDALKYGLASWYLYNHQKEKAKTLLVEIVNTNAWSSFGYIAAERDLIHYFNYKNLK